MKCINCGTEIQNGINFCPNCGASIISNSQESTIVSSQQNLDSYEDLGQGVTTPIQNQPIIDSMSKENENNFIGDESQNIVNLTTPMNGEKLGSSAPIISKKKHNIVLIFSIVLALLIIIGTAVFIYFYEFKSSSKRLEIISKNLFSFTNKINNSKIELASGKYEISGKLSNRDDVSSIALNGNYALDLKNEIFDFTINATSFNMGEELLPSPLNLELYLNDSKMYVLFQNFYDKYIYVTSPEIDQIFTTTAENDINYAVLVNGIRIAFTNSLKSANVKQKIEEVSINGKKQKANVITLVQTANNQRIMTTTFYRTLANNKAFLTEYAKIIKLDEEAAKERLLANLENQEYEGSDNRIEIYSPLFGESLLGIKVITKDEETNETNILEIYQITDGYGLNGTKNGKTILKADIKYNTKTNSKSVISNINVNLTSFKNDETYKAELMMNITQDVNPKVEKVNVKNSIDVQYLTEADIQTIISNMSSFGNLGMYLQQYIGTLMPDSKCNNAFNCQASTDGANSICNYCEGGMDICPVPEVITCPLS